MAEESSSSTVAGWYGDPSDGTRLRWWDGATWTVETRALAPVSTPVLAPASAPASVRTAVALAEAGLAVDQPLTRRELRAREAAAAGGAPATPTVVPVPVPVPVLSARASIVPGEAAAAPSASSASFSPRTPHLAAATAVLDRQVVGTALRDETGFVSVSTPQAPVSIFTPRRPTRIHTFSIWLLAILPLPWALGVRGLTGLAPVEEIWTVRAAALGVFIALSAICALRDGQVLRASRHSETASMLWVLLTPLVYLFVRTAKVRLETGVRSSGPVLLWLLAAAVAVVIVTGSSMSILALLPG